MSSLLQEVKRWATEELELPPDKLPPDAYIKTLCVGPGASIWKYVIQHIYNERNVRVMRGNLQWYKILQDKELKQVEGQNKDVQRQQLQREIAELQNEISNLEQKISTAEEQLSSREENVNRQSSLYEESRLKELMLNSYRLRCAEERDALTHHTNIISTQCQALEQLSKKAEVKLVFSAPSSSNVDSTTEPLVLRHVRELCQERVLFFQTLQENALNSSLSAKFTPEQRSAAHQHWLSAVEDVLRTHPSNQILLALQTLASKQQMALEEKTTTIDVDCDLSALGFRYESNHLLDVSVEGDDELLPVSSLMQAAQEEVECGYLHLMQLRQLTQQLQADLGPLIAAAKKNISGDQADSVSMCVFELEMQAVRQAAVRDSVREQCAKLQLHNKEKRQALRSLHTQWQSVMDFRQLVDIRQEQIRSLIKGNSTLKTDLVRSHSELKQFVSEKLEPQFDRLSRAAHGLRNSVSQEAKLFNAVSLAALDRRLIDGERFPVEQLSLFRVNSPALQGVRCSLCTPTYMAAEQLCRQAVSQKLQLRFLQRLLQMFTESLDDLQRRTARLPAPNQQALMQQVKMEDAKLLQTLLPRAHKLTERCSNALGFANQVHTAIAHWWEQPGQFALPEMQQEGLTFQQWLQRWKLAMKSL